MFDDRPEASSYREPLYFLGDGADEDGQPYQKTIVSLLAQNEAVGVVAGSYRDGYPVLFLSGFALHNLQMTFGDFLDLTKGNFIELVYPEDRGDFQARMEAKASDAWEYRLINKEGEPRWLEERRSECVGPDGEPLWVCSLRLANDAHAFQTELLSRVSHDMRTPLNAIMGTADRIASRCDDEKTKDDCYVIRAAAFRLLDMIERSVELSSEEVAAPERCAPVSLTDVVENAVYQVERKLVGKHQTLNTSVAVDDETVVADRLSLVKVLRVLLENASTFSGEGSPIDLSVTQRPATREGYGLYEVAVTDQGIGIAPQNIGRIFEPFAQVADSRIRDGIPHVGLGLAVAKSLVKAMGGSLTAESELGRGSVFRVALEMQVAGGVEESVGDLAGKRIMVVEDNTLNLEILRDYLEEEGATVTLAQDGSLAVQEFLDHAPGYFDSITMDIHMPVMDGYEAVRRIRALSERGGKSVRIVAVTSDNSDSDIRRILDSGMDAYVPKPIDFKTLKDALLS